MGFYSEQLVPRITHITMGAKPIQQVRARALQTASGVVLDVGFGSGLNLPLYPSSVEKVLAVEPSEVARNLAEPALAAAGFPVEFAGLDGQKISLPDASVDCVVTTWTLCTIPDPAIALAEFVRVLKPGGRYLFAEHGLSPDPGVARWQNRLDRFQAALAAGCHLNRPMDKLISQTPLSIISIEKSYAQGPRTHSYFYVGSAVK